MGSLRIYVILLGIAWYISGNSMGTFTKEDYESILKSLKLSKKTFRSWILSFPETEFNLLKIS